VKWNLRWAAAKRDIWRPSDLLAAFQQVGFNPSLSKVAALWGGKPISVRLDDLDKMCAALNCTVADLLEAEPLAAADGGERETGKRAVGAEDRPDRQVRPTPRRSQGRSRRSLPPN
jgi:DNA-binding Xre family transcriptional regulator